MMFDLSDKIGLKLLSAVGEAERCFHIFANPLAAERPVAAWLMLPRGLGVAETLLRLAGLPPDSAEERAVHRVYLDLLAARRATAQAAWQSHLASLEKPRHVATH